MAEKLYMQTDDRVKIGDKPMKHTDSKGQELHDRHVKNRKELLKQYKNYLKGNLLEWNLFCKLFYFV